MPVITVRISQAEQEQLTRRAKQSGISTGALVRRLLSEQAFTKSEHECVAEMVGGETGDKVCRQCEPVIAPAGPEENAGEAHSVFGPSHQFHRMTAMLFVNYLHPDLVLVFLFSTLTPLSVFFLKKIKLPSPPLWISL